MSQEKESLARTQLPYRAEYCKTSRATCKKCNQKMEAKTLKIASSVKSRFHDGFDYHYHHVECFFRIKRPTSVAEISHFETLKYEDQKMLERAIETNGKSVISGDASESTNGKGESSGNKKKSKRDFPTGDSTNYEDFLLEYAKSNRSTCIKCEQKIEKSTIRIGKLDYNADSVSSKAGPIPRWYHDKCFAKSLEKLEFYGDMSKVQGFDILEKADKKALKDMIKPIEPPETKVESKKSKNDTSAEEELLLRKQSDKFFKLREHVSTMKRKHIEAMLEKMHQKHDYKNSATLADMATDVLMFGPIKECPICKSTGHMQLRTSRYICTNTMENGEPCTYESSEPERGVLDIPDDVKDSYEFLERYKFKGGKRIFSSKLLKAVEEKEAENNNVVVEGGPLEGLTIGITSWQAIETEKTKVQKKVMALGGKLVTALDKSLFVILSSESELSKETPKIEVAKALDVPFCTEGFLFKIDEKDDVVEELSKCLIQSWDGDLKERFEKMSALGSKGDSSVKRE